MNQQKSQYDTKYTIPLVVVSIITIIIFFFIDNPLIETIAFTIFALILSLNFYEAYIAEDKEKHKFKLGFSIVAFVIFLANTILLLVK